MANQEVELKLELLSPKALQDRLVRIGAEGPAVERQVDTYFAPIGRPHEATDPVVRIRATATTAILTVKGAATIHAGIKSRAEYELPVDAEVGIGLLRELGFEPSVRFEKARATYTLEGHHVCIDTIEGYGSLVELEWQGAGDAKAGLQALQAGLGLGGANPIPWSSLELVIEAGSPAVRFLRRSA